MPNCAIIWDGNTLTLEVGRTGLQTTYKQERNMNTAMSGKKEFINLYDIQEMSIDLYVTEVNYSQFVAWWAWARQGKTFAFATDASNVGNTTLDAAAAAAQKVIPLTATTGFVATDYCLIRTAARTDFEVVQIASVSAGVSVTAENNLIYSYASGDEFRHYDYWPSVLTMDNTFAPKQTDAGWYRHTIKFTEAL